MAGRALAEYRSESYKSEALLSSTEILLNFIISVIVITKGKIYVLAQIITVKRLLVITQFTRGKKQPCVSFTVRQVKVTTDSSRVGVFLFFFSEGILLFNSQGLCDLPQIVKHKGSCSTITLFS